MALATSKCRFCPEGCRQNESCKRPGQGSRISPQSVVTKRPREEKKEHLTIPGALQHAQPMPFALRLKNKPNPKTTQKSVGASPRLVRSPKSAAPGPQAKC